MSRLRCSPCEIIVPVCDCCTEELCFCSKNSIDLSCAPCVCNPRGPYLGLGTPLFVEGWVPDDNYPALVNSHTVPGPQLSSLAVCANAGIGWDLNTTLFSYSASDLSGSTRLREMQPLAVPFASGSFGLFSGFNRHIANQVTFPINQLLMKDHVSTRNTPYNSQLFHMLKRKTAPFFKSLSTEAKDFMENLNHKSPSTYYFRKKYLKQLAKSILIGKFDSYFETDKMDYILSSSEDLYKNRAVPDLSPSYLTNLENIKEYVRDNRKPISARIVDGNFNQSFEENTLRKFWKVIPSDTDQRVRVYRTPQVVTWIYNHGPVVTSQNVSPSSIMSVKVNDDDTVSVYRISPNDGKVARAHYINAEVLRVFGTDGVGRYQSGCECVSGCHIKICSDRDKAYVFDPQDRAVLLGLLGGVSGVRFNWSPDEPYIELTTSSYLNNTPGNWNEIEFDPPPLTTTDGDLVYQTDYRDYNADNEWKDFYLLTPNLSGTDLLSSIIPSGNNTSDVGGLSGDHLNPYVRKTELTYKVRATDYTDSNKNVFDFWTKFISGPGNTFFVDHNDPIVKYLNRASVNCQEVSASMVDVNIDNILGEEEVYPRRVPYHIVIVPTDSRGKWNPFVSTSRITKMIDPTDSVNFDHKYDNGYIQRTLRMIPAPRKDVLDSNYLDLVTTKDYPIGPPYNMGYCTPGTSLGLLPGNTWESTQFAKGVEGIENDPRRMEWRARVNSDLGPSAASGISSSSIQTIFRTLPEGYEVPNSRKIDPVKRVFDWLTKAKYYYDNRTDVTYSHGLNPTTIQYSPYHPIVNPNSLPVFDVWRHLTMFEFHEFLLSFNDEFFSTVPNIGATNLAGGLKWNRFRDLQLFDSLDIFPEKTYLHTYAPQYGGTWSVSGIYGGNQYNFRNASGIDYMEQPRNLLNDNGVVMDSKDLRTFY